MPVKLFFPTSIWIKDFQFSDGTSIPAGTFVSAATLPTHHDEEYYENPDVFNPWRFADLREEKGEGLKHQMVSTSVEYMPFGHGRHAWWVFKFPFIFNSRSNVSGLSSPGRFFAANELKGMLAHLVVTYDIKMENEGVVPKPFKFEFHHVPNPNAEVLFRKRRV